jgi:lysophospholipase L1-like esterase
MQSEKKIMIKVILIVLGMVCQIFAQDKTDTDIWKSFRFFEGEWTGEETGKAGVGKGERNIEFIMNEKYLFYQNVSRFEPQVNNPEGETHEDWTFFSFDNNRKTFVLREFHSEGFVNQYTLTSQSEDGTNFVFISENVENAPSGMRARVTLNILNRNMFKETFELALPGKEFSFWLENNWTRKIDPDPERFREIIDGFLWSDQKNSLPSEAILFVGSSSIVLWETAKYFPGFPVINRGFGGSHISDVNYYRESVVLKYSPKVIVFYAGDNDVAAGKSDDRVYDDYIKFVKYISQNLPQTQLIYIPIKPSLDRWALWEIMDKTNGKIRDYSNQDQSLHYIDLATPMLNSEGKPDSSLFVEDGLHLNAKGYDLWTRILIPVLDKAYHEK